MDSRPVPVRTDASANDFWSRVRESSDVSPDFKIKPPTRLSERNKTPFGMQVHPFVDAKQRSMMMQVSPAVRSSRSVERIVLQKEVGKEENKEKHEEENDMTKANNQMDDDQREEVIRKLRKENAILHANLNRVLRINHALTSNMLSENTPARVRPSK